jgi:hypothetical protein
LVCKAKSLLAGESNSDNLLVLHLDAGPIIDVVVFKVLIPILTGATGGTISRLVTKDYLDRKSRSDLRKELYALTNKGISPWSSNTKEECIIVVHDLLKPLGATRIQAREIVEYLSIDLLGKSIKT